MGDSTVRPPRSLSVFFPCYNEEANVESTTLAALRTLRRIGLDFEVIVVNDGSKDRTREIADRLVREHPHVRVVHHPTNRGYGGALQSGFRAATKEWVFYTDGDGQFDFEELDGLFPLLDRFDIVSGYRIARQDPPIRKFNAWCWGKLVNALLGLRVRDVDCAFKIYPRKLFDEIEMKSFSALIDAEILARATRLGYRIGQIGVHHFPRTAGVQTGAKPLVVLHALRELLVLARDIRRTKRPDPPRAGGEAVRSPGP